ncbi:VOC family protein [Motilibacter aurantiacus]|uniref:VOC family protein n=1 Tax=Motilibacter aurantiacus TaxID=2714955 RepID=UPI00140859FF|nr:VOC family protein [Motilibacter aurantiacus]NHC47435.1 glyoxalase [Motilibacter aurantiacus]
MTLRLGFIGIVTRDMARSLAFYRVLGVPVPDGMDGAPHVDAQLDDATQLAWDTVETVQGFDPGYSYPTGGHRIALAFDQGTPAAVDATAQRLVDAGYAMHVEPWDAHWGQRYATFLDPDGNSVDLYAALPAS